MRLLTLARDLGRRKARDRGGLFLAEGVRTVEELVRSSLDVVGVLAAPKLSESPRGIALREALAARGVEVVDATDREFASAASTESPQGVLAVARTPEHSWQELGAASILRLLVLDAVQDPGNVGTLVRTAAALGAAATVALPGTVDLWNAKVVRSAMGAHFHHRAFHATWDVLHAWCGEHGVALWGADVAGGDVAAVHAPRKLALVVGNEGSGLSAPVREAAHALVALPTAPAVESLNVAVAAGILLFELRANAGAHAAGRVTA